MMRFSFPSAKIWLKTETAKDIASTYDVADYAVRMTIAYMLKYGLLDIDNFINLHELSEDEIIELNKQVKNKGDIRIK